MKVTTMNASGVMRCVTVARRTRPIGAPGDPGACQDDPPIKRRPVQLQHEGDHEPSHKEGPEHGEVPVDPRGDVVTGPAESDKDREAQGVHADGEGATGPRAHDAANIAGAATVTDHQSRVRGSYDAVTDAYVDRVHDELRHKPLDRALLTAFAEQLQEGFGAAAPVCDAGCGPGHVGAFLGRLGLEVTGIDLSPAMVARARDLHPELAFEVGTMTALAAPDARWRGLIAFYSIIHLTSDAEIRAALREFHRTIAEGGLILVAVHAGEHGDAIVHSDEMLGVGVDMDFRFFDIDWLAAEMAAAGLRWRPGWCAAPTPMSRCKRTPPSAGGARKRRQAYLQVKAHG